MARLQRQILQHKAELFQVPATQHSKRQRMEQKLQKAIKQAEQHKLVTGRLSQVAQQMQLLQPMTCVVARSPTTACAKPLQASHTIAAAAARLLPGTHRSFGLAAQRRANQACDWAQSQPNGRSCIHTFNT